MSIAKRLKRRMPTVIAVIVLLALVVLLVVISIFLAVIEMNNV
mgnify:CR=1 FL=1